MNTGTMKEDTSLAKIIIIALPTVIACIITIFVFRNMLILPVDAANTVVTNIEIAPGATVTSIAADLKGRHFIRSNFGFRLLYKLKGKGAPLKAGEYALSPSMTPKEILFKMIEGDVVKRVVLVKEGATLKDVAATVEQAGLSKQNEFSKALVDKEFLKRAGIGSGSFEGYLYPDTYYFSRPITAQEIIWTMVTEAEKHWPEEFSNQADVLRMTRHDVLTLASIIEKESGNAEEMPIISSVFHNRLNQGMRLQSDPTVIYGIPNFNGNLTKADLERPSAYNTYLNFGLPPSPIANPSQKAVHAALYPKDTDFLYFVGDGKGHHIFSTNLEDHNAAVATYQLGRGVTPTAVATSTPLTTVLPTPVPVGIKR